MVRSFARNGDYELDGVRVHASGWAATHADVVVSHLGDDNQGAKLAHRWSAPSVRMVHGRSSYPARHLDRYPTDLAVFPSAAMRDEVGWEGKSIVAHPPIEPSEYATEHGDLVTIVNLHKHKGGKLFWLLARSMRDTEFLAVRGRGPQEIHQAPNVEVIPTTGDIRRRVYGRTRLLLVPSCFESFGRVAIEAACSGIPTIAHPSPGMREALGDAATWVRRTEPNRWVDAIRRLSEQDAWVEASVRALELAAGLDPEPSLNGFAEAVTSLVRVPA